MNIPGNDWVKEPLSARPWWCLPLGLGLSLGLTAVSPRPAAFVWTVLSAWMGTGCLLNARRCHRLHCYISGPIFFLGAVATVQFAAGIIQGRLNNIVSAVLVLAVLSFVPGMVRARYRSERYGWRPSADGSRNAPEHRPRPQSRTAKQRLAARGTRVLDGCEHGAPIDSPGCTSYFVISHNESVALAP
jgi:hypothetical protein